MIQYNIKRDISRRKNQSILSLDFFVLDHDTMEAYLAEPNRVSPCKRTSALQSEGRNDFRRARVLLAWLLIFQVSTMPWFKVTNQLILFATASSVGAERA